MPLGTTGCPSCSCLSATMCAASSNSGSGRPDSAQRPLYAVITASRNDAWCSRCLALVIVPDLAARLRKHSLDRQQEPHLLRFEDATSRIDERDAFTFENEAGLQLGHSQVIVHVAQPSNVLEGRQTHECV